MTLVDEEEIRITLRFPSAVRDQLKAAADRSGRSMNAEIVHRLEQSFVDWPKVQLPPEFKRRAETASQGGKALFETNLNAMAVGMFDEHFPPEKYYAKRMLFSFEAILDMNPQIGSKDRNAIEAEFKRNLENLMQKYQIEGE